MLAHLSLVVIGLALLTYASDQFVTGAARLSVRFNLAPVLVGAVVIGFGTSAPELVVTALAARQGSIEIAVGNIIGSNVANLSLVLGTAVLITRLGANRATLRREVPLSLLSVLLFAAFVQNGLTVVEGLVLLGGLTASLTWMIAADRDDDSDLGREVEEFVSDEGAITLPVEIPRLLLGLIGTVASAQILINGALGIAATLGLAAGFVGLTLVAVGTSLPELATAVQAARKGEDDLIVGNLLGSNLFNSLAVGGGAALLGPGPITDTSLTGLAAAVMVVIAVLVTVFLATGRALQRWEGLVLLAIWLGSLPFLA